MKLKTTTTSLPSNSDKLKAEKITVVPLPTKINNLHVFNKYLNNNYKVLPFKRRIQYVGEIKYSPPISKEWKNSIYVYNKNYLKNLPVYDQFINYFIERYFNIRIPLKNINYRNKLTRYKRRGMMKIFVSKAEIKHTNSKAILTLYTYNRERISLFKKLKSLKRFSYKIVYKIIRKLNKIFWKRKSQYLRSLSLTLSYRLIKALFYRRWRYFKRYKLRLNLNQSKFEEKLLYLLSTYISKYYNKRVIFNIVNLKSFILNSDLFTKILTLKVKHPKSNVTNLMKTILNKAELPRVNRVIEKSEPIKTIDFNLLENKYKNVNINSILNSRNKNNDSIYLDNLLKDGYKNIYDKYGSSFIHRGKIGPISANGVGGALEHFSNNLAQAKASLKQAKASLKQEKATNKGSAVINEIIFKSIKYKNMGGVTLEINGRLTKRYRADRSVHKFRWKGGLNNIDASYKRLSVITKRGFIKPNVEYSIYTSKRRIGAFAVKGWLAGKS